jgi:predicted MFS family arabinose efflux permease
LATSQSPPSFPWRLGFAGLSAIGVGVGFGRFSFTPLIPQLIENHWFPVAQADYLGATNLMGYLLGSMIATSVAARFPIPWIQRLSMLTVALGYLLCAQPGSFIWFAFWRFAIGVTGAFLMILTAPTLLSHVHESFHHHLRSLIFTGLGLGIIFSATLLPFLLTQGLSWAWLCLGLFSFLLTIIFWTAWPDPEIKSGADSAIQKPNNAQFTTPVLILLLMYCASATGLVPCTVFWVDYISRGLQLGIQTASFNWILFGIGATLGPPAAGWIAQRWGFKKSIQIGLSLMAAANIIPIFCHEPTALALSSTLIGCFAMSIVSLVLGQSGQLAGLQGQRQVWGWMTLAFSLVQAGVAYAFSYLFAKTNSYDLLFGLSAGALILGVLLGFKSFEKKKTEA